MRTKQNIQRSEKKELFHSNGLEVRERKTEREQERKRDKER